MRRTVAKRAKLIWGEGDGSGRQILNNIFICNPNKNSICINFVFAEIFFYVREANCVPHSFHLFQLPAPQTIKLNSNSKMTESSTNGNWIQVQYLHIYTFQSAKPKTSRYEHVTFSAQMEMWCCSLFVKVPAFPWAVRVSRYL